MPLTDEDIGLAPQSVAGLSDEAIGLPPGSVQNLNTTGFNQSPKDPAGAEPMGLIEGGLATLGHSVATVLNQPARIYGRMTGQQFSDPFRVGESFLNLPEVGLEQPTNAETQGAQRHGYEDASATMNINGMPLGQIPNDQSRMGKLAQIAAGLYGVGRNAANELATPENLPLAVMRPESLLSRAAALYFAHQMLTQATPEAAGRASVVLPDPNADLGQKVQAIGDVATPAVLGALTGLHGFHEPTVGPSGLTAADHPGVKLEDYETMTGKPVAPADRQLPFKRFSVDETGQAADFATLSPEDRATWMKGPVEDQAQTPSTEAQTSQSQPGLSDQEIGLQESQISASQSSGKAASSDLNSIGGSIELEAAKSSHIEESQDAVGQSSVKQLAPDLRISVQNEQEMTHPQTGEKVKIPGYVQLDEVKDGKNTWSKGPESLKAEGYDVPDYSKLPQGKYTVNEANEILKRGKATKLYSGIPLLDPDYVNEVLVPKTRQLLRNTKELRLNIGKGLVDGGQIVARLLNKAPEKERQILIDSGIKEVFPPGSKTTPDMIDTWLKEKGPKVEVKVIKSGDKGPDIGFNLDRYDKLTPKEGKQTVVILKTPLDTEKGDVNGILHQGSHLDKEDKNVLGWARVQYEETPQGKVAHVIVSQSDWAHKLRDEEKVFQDILAAGGSDTRVNQQLKTKYHPLVPDYNRLVMKAVIDQAKKDGAKFVAVSDAETAMMTQEHDMVIPKEGKLKQEAGMRLNYDQILPKIMRELTGKEGTKIDLGEHKKSRYFNETFQMSEPRDDLHFKDGNGKYKRNVTANSFPIDHLNEGPYSITGGRLYMLPILHPVFWHGVGKSASAVHEWWNKQARSTAADIANKVITHAIGAKIEERLPTKPLPGQRSTTGMDLKNKVGAAVNALSASDKAISPIDVLVDTMDGGKAKFNGPLMNNIRKPLDNAFNAETALKDSLIDPVVKLKKELKLNKENGARINTYLVAQQPNGIQRLVDSGVPRGTVTNIIRSLSPEEMRVADMMRKKIDFVKPLVEAMGKEFTGKDTPLPDKFFPIQADYDRFFPEPKTGVSTGGVKTEQGFLKDKLSDKTPIRDNAFEVYDKFMRDASHFLMSQKLLADAQEVVKSKEFRTKYGAQGQSLMLNWLNNYARQGRRGSNYPKLDQVMTGLRQNIARGILAFRLGSQLIHLTNVPLAMQRTDGPLWWKRGLEHALSKEGRDFIKTHFAETFERGGGEPGLQEATKGKISEVGTAPQKYIDQWNSQATVMGIYLKALDKAGKDYRQFSSLPVDQAAIEQARVLARRAVASPLYKDVPPALSKGAAMKMLLQFQNTFLDQWSNIRYDLPEYIRNLDAKSAAGLTAALATMLVIETGIKLGAKKAVQKATGYEPKEDEHEVVKKLAEEALKRVPGVGQVLAASQRGDIGVPGLDVIREGGSAVKTAATADSGIKKNLAYVKVGTAVGELLGVPGTSQASEFVQDSIKAKAYMSHEKKLAAFAKQNGLPLKTFDDRIEAERAMHATAEPMSESVKVSAAESAQRKMLDRRKQVLDGLSKEDSAWLKQHQIDPPGYGSALHTDKVRVALTEAEDKRLVELVRAGYTRVIDELRKDKGFGSLEKGEKVEVSHKMFRDAAKEARATLQEEIESRRVQ